MRAQLTYWCSDSKRGVDSAVEKIKDKPIGQILDTRFSWSELADAVADVYLAVSQS
jgi:hypothetical protein